VRISDGFLTALKKLDARPKSGKPEKDLTDFLDDTVDELNRTLRQIPVKQLNGQIVEATIPASSELRISHLLGSVPKYRIILGQSGSGVISDAKGKDSSGVEKWTKKYITLKNNGASSQDIIVLIVKE
jgi:hypothetical protein